MPKPASQLVFSALILASAIVGCAGSSTAAVEVAPPPPASPTASAAATVAARTKWTSPAFFVQNDVGETRIPLQIQRDAEPCVLIVRSGPPNRVGAFLILPAVNRIVAEAGTSCTAHVLLDAAVPANADDEVGVLEAMAFRIDDATSSDEEGEIADLLSPVDMNFDDHTDLRVLWVTGAYDSSYVMFVFDPVRLVFERNEALEGLLWASFDKDTKTVHSGGRYSGPSFGAIESRWIDGELVYEKESLSIFGVDPKGNALPKGFYSYQVRRERRNGVMTTVFDGPVR